MKSNNLPHIKRNIRVEDFISCSGIIQDNMISVWNIADIANNKKCLDSTIVYLNDYYYGKGREVAFLQPDLNLAVRMYHMLRMDTLGYTNRLKRVFHIDLEFNCACCESIHIENREHILITCPRWETIRKKRFGDLNNMSLLTLLGGEGEETDLRMEVVLFLKEIIPLRNAILIRHGLKKKPVEREKWGCI